MSFTVFSAPSPTKRGEIKGKLTVIKYPHVLRWMTLLCDTLGFSPDSVRPHRWQPTRLLRPWDSPGKNTGVGCHFLLQCMKVKSESEIAQSCPTPSDPMDCSLLGSSIHGIFQARVLEWVAVAFCSFFVPLTSKSISREGISLPWVEWLILIIKEKFGYCYAEAIRKTILRTQGTHWTGF